MENQIDSVLFLTPFSRGESLGSYPVSLDPSPSPLFVWHISYFMGGNVVRDTTEINEAFFKSPEKNSGLKAVDKEAGETNVPIFFSSHPLISVTLPPTWPDPTGSQRDKSEERMGEGKGD